MTGLTLPYADLTIEALGRLLHAARAQVFVFVGPDGVGKRAAARVVAAEWLGVPESRLAIDSDFSLLAPPEERTAAGRERTIAIDDVRAFISRLSLSASRENKVGLIEGAESLTFAAQNALLKTLEEPTAKTLIILLATDLDSLLPTVRSRVVPVRFPLLSFELMADRYGEEVARLAQGRAAFAEELVADKDLRAEVEAITEDATAFVAGDLAARFKLIERYTKGAKATIERRDLFLHAITAALRARLAIVATPELAAAYEAALKADEGLRGVANPTLLFEEIALGLQKV